MKKSGGKKEGSVVEQRKLFEERRPESKQECFWEKRKKANEIKKQQDIQLHIEKPVPESESEEENMEVEGEEERKE